MTGYGRAEAANARLGLAVEVKSVNHRHLDIAVKLPRAIASLEQDVRRLVQSAVQRGRVDVSVSLVPVEGRSLNPLTVDLVLAREYVATARRLADETSLVGGATVAWLLGQPGVISREGEPAVTAEEAWPLLEQTLTRALAELVGRRETEGEALRRELLAVHAALAAQVDVDRGARAGGGGAPVGTAPGADPGAPRGGAHRRDAHRRPRSPSGRRRPTSARSWRGSALISTSSPSLLGDGGLVGRTLDFLLQETNREVNTVGSKADDLEISQAVIAAKSLLEKLREQTQNLE